MGSTQPRRIEERFIRELWLALMLLGLALAQAALMPRMLGLAPNLLLLLTICQALIAGPTNAARWAFYAGLALDLSADTALGLHALALRGPTFSTTPTSAGGLLPSLPSTAMPGLTPC